MKQEIKNYLNKIEEKNPSLYFLLWRFYLNPSNTLEDNNKKFYKKDFLLFLKLYLKDESIKKRLDDKDLKKIHYHLFDIKEEWEENFSKKINAKKRLTKKDLNLLAKEFNNKNNYFFLLNYLIKKTILLEEEYCENNILPKLEKEKIFNTIINDDYKNNLENCFLFERHGKDTQSIEFLLCDNDFLNIVEKYLLNYKLPYIIIYNIIEILQTSITIKNFKYRTPDSKLTTKSQNFNYQKTIKLIKELEKKEGTDSKIIPFSLRKIKI